VSNAVSLLRKAGFTLDFKFANADLFLGKQRVDIDDLRIVKFFRYEGDSDPADEAFVYMLEARNGQKGILVTGDDSNADFSYSKVLKKLHQKLLGAEQLRFA